MPATEFIFVNFALMYLDPREKALMKYNVHT